MTHNPSICPKYYVGYSKGMEAPGAARITSHFFKTGKVVIGEHVSNDDSSSWMVMWHSYQDLVDAGWKMMLAQWPRYSKGKNEAKKPNNGFLPVNHPPMHFKAGEGHQVCNYT
jgi:hypothetical protein